MRGAVSIALAYNQASCGNCFFWSSVFSSELYFKIQIRAVFVRESWIKEREMALMSYLIDLFYFIWMQFTRSGHTQLRANAIMITSTISVVLVSTVVRHLLHMFCILTLIWTLKLFFLVNSDTFQQISFSFSPCCGITLALALLRCVFWTSV